MIVIFMSTYFFHHSLHKVQPVRFTGGFLEGECVIATSMFETRILVKLGRLSRKDLDLSSFQISLAEKIAVSDRMDLATDMAKYLKRSMRQTTLGMPFILLYFY